MLEVYGFRLAYILYFQISQYHWSKADQFKSVRYPKMPDLRVSSVIFCWIIFRAIYSLFYTFSGDVENVGAKAKVHIFFLQKVRNHIVKETFFNLLPPQ